MEVLLHLRTKGVVFDSQVYPFLGILREFLFFFLFFNFFFNFEHFFVVYAVDFWFVLGKLFLKLLLFCLLAHFFLLNPLLDVFLPLKLIKFVFLLRFLNVLVPKLFFLVFFQLFLLFLEFFLLLFDFLFFVKQLLLLSEFKLDSYMVLLVLKSFLVLFRLFKSLVDYEIESFHCLLMVVFLFPLIILQKRLDSLGLKVQIDYTLVYWL